MHPVRAFVEFMCNRRTTLNERLGYDAVMRLLRGLEPSTEITLAYSWYLDPKDTSRVSRGNSDKIRPLVEASFEDNSFFYTRGQHIRYSSNAGSKHYLDLERCSHSSSLLIVREKIVVCKATLSFYVPRQKAKVIKPRAVPCVC